MHTHVQPLFESQPVSLGFESQFINVGVVPRMDVNWASHLLVLGGES